MSKSADRGQQALAERLSLTRRTDSVLATQDDRAAAILGEHGVFIPDAREHEAEIAGLKRTLRDKRLPKHAIEAEARAALLAELRAKVEGLPDPWTNPAEPEYPQFLDRAAVLALLAEPLGNSKP